MTNLKTRFATAIATGAVLLNALAPVTFAATEIQITGNGAGSNNTANVSANTTTVVTQNNTANVTNNIDVDADTGDNDANFNTGGNVTIDTGNATVNTTVTNALNTNTARVDCCPSGNTNVTISDNGALSNNSVDLTQVSTTVVTQNNDANVTNDVEIDAETGENSAGFNTGDGDVVIRTGNAKVNVDVSTIANANVARIGSNNNGGSNPTASFLILGNGAGSDNDIDALLANTVVLTQDNDADVDNDVDVDAETGENDANFNTGDGSVVIDTGNANATVDIDNLVNFNAADLNCGCTWDVLAKIANNGAGGFPFNHHYVPVTDSSIDLTLASTQVAGQNNESDLYNDVDVEDSETGENSASLNTSGSDSDPSVLTGNADATVRVSNSGNTNVLGDTPLTWPFGSNSQVGFNFNWSAFLAVFGLH